MSAAGLSFLCNKCGGQYPNLEGLLRHACPFLAARARGFTPEQAAIEAHLRMAAERPTQPDPPAPADLASVQTAEAPREMDTSAIEQSAEIQTEAYLAAPIEAVAIPAPKPIRRPGRPRVTHHEPVSKTLAAVQATANRSKGKYPTPAMPPQPSQRRKGRRPSADVAADKAARALQREQKAAIIASADYLPEPLPDSGTLPLHEPTATDNPMHPVRSSLIAPRWKRTSSGPPKPIRYCACGMALPLRPCDKCENCGRTI